MEKIILRRLELLQNGDWTKEETLKNILDLIEDYSIKFLIFANKDIVVLDKLFVKFDKHYSKTININGNERM